MTKSRTKKQLKQLIEQQAEERHARWLVRSMNKRGVHKPIYKLKPQFNCLHHPIKNQIKNLIACIHQPKQKKIVRIYPAYH